MKHFLITVSAILAIVALSSCKKEETTESEAVKYSSVTLTVSPEPDKLTDSDGTEIREFNWAAGNTIIGFFGTGYSAKYYVADINNGRASSFNTDDTGNYYTSTCTYFNKAMYPYQGTATVSDTDVTLSLKTSATATTDPAKLEPVMIGRSKNTTLQLYNINSYIKFSVSTPGIAYVTVKSIDTDVKLAGKATFSFDESGLPYVKSSDYGSSSIDIIAPNYGFFEPGVTYYARLLPADLSASGYMLYYRCPKGYYCVTNNKPGIKFVRNHITELKDMETTGYFVPCSGYFQCDGEGRRLHFATGNLQYVKDKNVWRFAAEQYELSKDNNVIDQFGWSTDAEGNNWGMGSVFTGEFKDWGENKIVSSDNSMTFDPSFWITPDCEQLRFLLMKRNSSSIGKISDARFFKASVGNVPGIMLIPDVFTWPSELELPVKINESEASFDLNKYSIEQFELLEAKGVAFLPISGYKSGGKQYDSSTKGFYWEADSSKRDGYSYAMNLDYNSVALTNAFVRSNGYNVRLAFSLDLAE